MIAVAQIGKTSDLEYKDQLLLEKLINNYWQEAATYSIKHPPTGQLTKTQRAKLLFKTYPDILQAYDMGNQLRSIFNENTEVKIAYTKLAQKRLELSLKQWKM